MNKKIGFLLLVFCYIYIQGITQFNDAGLWANVDIDKKLTGGFTASLSEELRFNENISELGTAFTEIGIQHKINK